MKTLRWSFVDHFMLLAHGSASPDLEEWTLYCRDFEEHASNMAGTIVVTDGVGPNARQRSLLVEAQGKHVRPAAIVTSSRLALGIMTAINWLGGDLKGFSPNR